MGNRMEHYETEVSEYDCACGAGNYTISKYKYRDDYSSEEIKTVSLINCSTCKDDYLAADQYIVPKQLDQILSEATAEVNNLCQVIKEYSLAHYKKDMIHYVTSIPVTRWYALWQIISPSIQTFRKDLKMLNGQANAFEYHLMGNHENTIKRIIATLEKCGIEDSKLSQWISDLGVLTHKETQAKNEINKALFKGKLNKKYVTYEDPYWI
ncbi:hypothetical protein FE296_19100 [Paenibacillus sp. UASWS1643]|nr:hypothetical protein FE296_19100 [Paenibacillus sp. UASWS1643]